MNRPAPVEITYECMRFLITHNPTNSQLAKFTEVGFEMVVVNMNSHIYMIVKVEHDFICRSLSGAKEFWGPDTCSGL